jgi:hypothetical protein
MSDFEAIHIEYNFEDLDDYTPALRRRLQTVVDKFGQLIKARAQYYVPVDQGVAKASIYTDSATIQGAERGPALAQAVTHTEELSRYGHEGRTIKFAEQDELEGNVPPLYAIIVCAVIYWAELEFGGSNVRATNPGAQRPFMRPALDDFETMFEDACERVVDGLNSEFNSGSRVYHRDAKGRFLPKEQWSS